MPSRKRNNGRARGAKEAKIAAAGEHGATYPSKKKSSCRAVEKKFFENLKVMHGFISKNKSDSFELLHAKQVWGISEEEFFAEHHPTVGIWAMAMAIRDFPKCWMKESLRNSLKQSIIDSGVISIIDGSLEHLRAARAIAAAVLLLENYDSTMKAHRIVEKSTFNKQCLQHRDALEGCNYSLTRFFKKRIDCGCLDEEWAEAKRHPKTGVCGHCRERKDRSELMICSSCKCTQYCSQACWKAGWPSHKDLCKRLSEVE